MAKQQAFFCEFCKAEVPEDATSCSVCGSKFSAVRCPKCGNTGPKNTFTDGCPVCGYASKASSQAEQSAPVKTVPNTPKATQPSWWLFYAAAVVAIGCLAGLLLVL
jgi:ribosomal protein L40E